MTNNIGSKLLVVLSFVLVLTVSCTSPSGTNNQFSTENDTETKKTNYETRKATVIRVYDGDTFKVRLHDNGVQVPLRIKGIDCPETSRETDKCWDNTDRVDLPCPKQIPLGKKITRISRKRAEGQVIRLESYDGFKRDQHNRMLAYVRLSDGNDYGYRMVKEGYCRAFGERFDHPRADKYLKHDEPLSPLEE